MKLILLSFILVLLTPLSGIQASDFEGAAKEERKRQQAFIKDRLNRLQQTTAFPMLKDLPKKSIVFSNTHELNQTNVGLVMGCSEMGLSPSNVSFDQSGDTLSVRFENVESPFGIVPVIFTFIEGGDQWLVKRVKFGSQVLTRPGDLIPTMGGLMHRGDCLG